MSNFLLENLCNYLRLGLVQIKFRRLECIESDIYSLEVFVEGKYIETFKLTRGDKKVIEFIIKVEGIKDAIRC